MRDSRRARGDPNPQSQPKEVGNYLSRSQVQLSFNALYQAQSLWSKAIVCMNGKGGQVA